MNRPQKNMAASVRARLLNHARETGRPFNEILQYYGMERFMYRLSVSPHAGRFVLKGALLFTVWQIPGRRTTLDIDLAGRGSSLIDDMTGVIKDIFSQKVPDDGLVFDGDSVQGSAIRADMEYEGVRIKFRGYLEKARIPMQLDIGFGDAVYPRPRLTAFPVYLDFPAPRIKTYPAEAVVSEKFEAMIRLGALNSRMKDFYDVWLLTRTVAFDGSALMQALVKTFKRRDAALPGGIPFFAQEIYDSSSDRQMLWTAFCRKSGLDGVPSELHEPAAVIERFLAPVLTAVAAKKSFNGFWKKDGPWREKGEDL